MITEEIIKDKKIYNTFNKELLKEVLGWQAESNKEEEITKQVLAKIEALKIQCSIITDVNGNILIVKGKADLYPCVVSHLDQVHDFNKNKKVFEHEGTFFAFDGKKQIGTGGDDLCGLYICLQALIDYKNIKIAFFTNEESGMTGSGNVSLDFFKDCKFIAQPDRKGNSDFITYTNGTDVCSDEFKEFVKPIIDKYDYKFTMGSATDIGKLVNRKVGLSCFNISCGYYEAHSKSEIVIIEEVNNCYCLIREIIDNADKQYVFIKKEVIYNHINTKSEEDELYDCLTLSYKEENPKTVPLFLSGVNRGIKFVLDYIKGIDKEELKLNPKTYTIHDQIFDSVIFETDVKTTVYNSFQDDADILENFIEDKYNKKECNGDKCDAYAAYTYNMLTNDYDYECSKCYKVLNKK